MNVVFAFGLNDLLGGGEGMLPTLIYTLFLVGFFFFYPRIMLTQIMWKLERTARDLEILTEKAKHFVISEIDKTPDKALRESVSRFFNFFVIAPVSLDPYGIVKKYDHVLKGQENRFEYFVGQVAPHADKEKQANLVMGLAGGITLNEISKIVRHYVEMIKQTKSFQFAMILQMQLPLVERISKAIYKGTRAMAVGHPIGDGIGPLVAAELVGSRQVREIEKDIVYAAVPFEGHTLHVLKAKGPGGRLGDPGKAIGKVLRAHKVGMIVTVDAAAKLEGEKTGTVAEGVGVAMGGPGVERSIIEDEVTRRNIPIDSIVVKMSQEEAIMPMKKAIADALPEVQASLRRSLQRAKKGEGVIVLGVGNTSGVGNSSAAAKKTVEWVEAHHKKHEEAKNKKKKRKLY